MRVLVYGTGGVGAFFGGLLAHAGEDVHFVARGPQLDALRASGLTIESAILGDIHVPQVSAFPSAAAASGADLVLVCVKAHQTAGILDDLAAVVGEETLLVPLQNGVESDETLAARFGNQRVLPAVVYVGATVRHAAVVSHVAAGKIGLGAPAGFDPRRLEAVRALLARTGQAVHVSQDIQRERWRKLMWNAAFNTVSAITSRDPVALLSLAETRALIVGLMREVLAVARAHGVDLRDEDVTDQIAWTEDAHGLRTSTAVDRERGRTMESDALVGVIVRKGREAQIPTPRCELVYALLKAIDAPGET